MDRNVKRFREMLGLKQEGLAYELGDDWNQQRISSLEQKETIEDNLLEQVSKALKVPVSAIKNFDEEKVINIINNIGMFIHLLAGRSGKSYRVLRQHKSDSYRIRLLL